MTSCSNDNETNDNSKISSAAAAAKRKGSFKKWLRASHKKLTSNVASNKSSKENCSKFSNLSSSLTNSTTNGSETDNHGKIKVLSNSEDLKIKKWLPLEAHNEDQEEDDESEQVKI